MKFREELTVKSRWLKETTISIQCDHSESMSIPNKVKRKYHEIVLWYTKLLIQFVSTLGIQPWNSTILSQFMYFPYIAMSLWAKWGLLTIKSILANAIYFFYCFLSCILVYLCTYQNAWYRPHKCSQKIWKSGTPRILI